VTACKHTAWKSARGDNSSLLSRGVKAGFNYGDNRSKLVRFKEQKYFFAFFRDLA